MLDYEGLPFRCHKCHERRHLARNCPKFVPSTTGRRKWVRQTEALSSKETNLNTASNENPLRSEGTEQPLDQPKRAGAVVEKGLPQQMEQCLIASPPPGMNTSSLSNQLNDLSLNEEKYLPTPIANSPPPPKNDTSSLAFKSTSNSNQVASPSTIKNDSPTQSSSIHFHLRSRDVPISQKPKIPTKGLGVNARITSKGKGRGRPSHLSTAQSMALRDQASGRQTTIFGVLRAVQTLDGVPK